MTLIGYIPARGGSKRLKNKNFIDFHHGKSITEIALIKSRSVPRINFTVLDTDVKFFLDKIYRDGLSDYSGIRDKNLADDNISTVDSLRDCILKVEKQLKIKVKNIVLLQPTSPLISLKSINKVIDKFFNEDLDLVASHTLLPVEISDCLIRSNNKIKKIDNFKIEKSEEMIFDTGGVYLISSERLFYHEKPFSIDSVNNICMIPLEEFVDIDRFDQFKLAQRLYSGIKSLT